MSAPKTTKNSPTIAITQEQVKELLKEGRLVRAEWEQKMAKMHEVSLEARFSRAK